MSKYRFVSLKKNTKTNMQILKKKRLIYVKKRKNWMTNYYNLNKKMRNKKQMNMNIINYYKTNNLKLKI